MANPVPSINGIVRRMVNIPRTLLGEMSRMMDDLMGTQGQWRTNQFIQPNSSNVLPFQHPSLAPVSEQWDFLTTFEQQYGTFHPFFYACKFHNVLKMAQDEQRLIFIYLHSPDHHHSFATNFCRQTLCHELAVEFLDANFISWGGIASRGEGYHLATILKPVSFPFCAVVAPCGDNLEIERPVSPYELVEILQGTLEDQGLAFGSDRAKKEEEKRRVDKRLREEQDIAYLAALRIDEEKDKGKLNNHQEKLKQKTIFSSNSPNNSQTGNKGSIGQSTKILIRFPNGDRREKSFMSTDKIEAIFEYIDSLGLHGIGKYRLISSFPKKVYGVEQMGMTLKEAALIPQASLFFEFL
ncbi:plant UBX domain-containing protein 10-like isoform X2 [Impatiens glandulifera]|uniref:plant UBX domain-containing protein 10-like isoform X2 n=1 Tax=Impatiens glandulifera TaxID=253017 RepID=UPI001FB16EF9|nr:plant UBX domain-containing protein 10-like isoform X2 [Impatiens glandulifera]